MFRCCWPLLCFLCLQAYQQLLQYRILLTSAPAVVRVRAKTSNRSSPKKNSTTRLTKLRFVLLRHVITCHCCDCNTCVFQVEVFLREAEKMVLDTLLHQEIMRRIVTLQRRFWSRYGRARFLRMRRASIAIQVRISDVFTYILIFIFFRLNFGRVLG